MHSNSRIKKKIEILKNYTLFKWWRDHKIKVNTSKTRKCYYATSNWCTLMVRDQYQTTQFWIFNVSTVLHKLQNFRPNQQHEEDTPKFNQMKNAHKPKIKTLELKMNENPVPIMVSLPRSDLNLPIPIPNFSTESKQIFFSKTPQKNKNCVQVTMILHLQNSKGAMQNQAQNSPQKPRDHRGRTRRNRTQNSETEHSDIT